MALNPTQQRAVEHRGSPLLVLAGAGTGKTRVITHRVAALLDEGVRPWEILAVTFTNKAAGEMRERIEHLTGETNVRRAGMWVGTFHSICARLLRRHGTGVGLTDNFAICVRILPGCAEAADYAGTGVPPTRKNFRKGPSRA